MFPSEKIADFIHGFSASRIPDEAGKRAKAGILDYIGVALLGFPEPCAQRVRETAAFLGGNPQATIWGAGVKTSILLAALANGTAAHALDYDDVNSTIRSHPSIQLLPGLFALAEHEHTGGNELLAAYLAGFEVGAKLGRVINPNLVYQGWFPVGTLGTLMQAAACARLLRLSPEQVQMALGLAANMAAGLRCNNGTMAKPLAAGHLGANGALAALLARQGMSANPRALEGRFGFFENFSRGDRTVLENAFASLGEEWEMLRTGITHKLYPCCAGSHPAIDCALQLSKIRPLPPEEIREVAVSISSHTRYLLIHSRPRTEMEAKFSLEYAVARALLDGEIGPRQFSPEKIEERKVRALMEKVRPCYYDPPAGAADASPLPVKLEIRLESGEVVSATADYARGSPRNPISHGEIEEKFRQCCQGALSEAAVRRVVEGVRDLESLADVGDLVGFLAARHR